jgi:peptide/nickel transport system substrate-binding protein
MTVSLSKQGPSSALASDGSSQRRRHLARGFAMRPKWLSLRLWLTLAVVAVLAGAAFIAGCGNAGTSGQGASPGGPAKKGGILKIGTTEGVDSLNQFISSGAQDGYNIRTQIYPQLVQYDPQTLDFIPDFATTWTTSADGRTWTFQTRPNAKWSDGQPLTAADVAWTYTIIKKFANTYTGSVASLFANLQSATAPTPTTVVLKYAVPMPNVLANAQHVCILPEHIWQSYAAGNGSGLKTFTAAPTADQPTVSGGAFICTKLVRNQVALFKRNPNYYGTPPNIDGFGLQVFSNQDAMISALQLGQIDAIENVPVTSVSVLQKAGFNVAIGPSLTSRVFIFNSNPNKTTHRELLNPLVRKAFEYGVDRNQIIQTAWLGYGTPGTSLVPPSTGKWFDPSLKPLPFDLAQANQLLDQAGYKMGSNGLRIANGHPMSYEVIFPTDQSGPGDRAFQIIQADFAKMGVQLHQKVLDPSATFAAIIAPDNKYLTFDLAMWWWIPVIDPTFILGVTTTAEYGNWSDSGYSNPVYDQLYKKFTTTMDPAEQIKLAYQMERMIYDARVYIVINYNDTIDAWSTKWAGFLESPQGFLTQLSKQCLTSVHQL